MSLSLPYKKPVLALFGIVTALLVVHALFPAQVKPMNPEDLATEECKGEPINVPVAYTGNVVEPWSCQPQCNDNKQRYLLYTNGAATQCETPPGCNDFGEDRGVTCRVPAKNLSSSQVNS